MFRILVGLTLCVGMAATARAQDPKVAQGAKVYAEQKCAICHSIDGKGNRKGPLDSVGTKLKNEEIREWIVDPKGMTAKTKAPRKPGMKSFTLPKEDVEALADYLVTLKKK